MLKCCLGKIAPILLAATTLRSYLCQMYLETGANKPHSRLEEFRYEWCKEHVEIQALSNSPTIMKEKVPEG